MSERIGGSYDDALYKSTYNLLYYFTDHVVVRNDTHTYVKCEHVDSS